MIVTNEQVALAMRHRLPIFTPGDDKLITKIAYALYLDGNRTHDAIELASRTTDAINTAADCVYAFRKATRVRAGKPIIDALPVIPVKVAGDGGGRFYWRVRCEYANGQTVEGSRTYDVSTVDDKKVGSREHARRRAMDMYVQGQTPIGLVPPDIDPQDRDDERQANRAKPQEAGLTVRQRTKKH